MKRSSFETFLPWSGVVSGVLFAGALLATGPEPDLDPERPQKAIDWALAHQGAEALSGISGALFVLFMLMFVAHVRAVLRSGEAGESTYSSVAYAGGIGVALSTGTAALLSFALSKADDQAAHTLVYLSSVTWLPWAACSGAFLLATGLGAMKTLALPRWLAITTAVLGVLSVTGPTGILVFLLTPFWLVTTGIVLARRQASAAPLRVDDAALAR